MFDRLNFSIIKIIYEEINIEQTIFLAFKKIDFILI